MEVKEKLEIDKDTFQRNLANLRKLCKWTAEELAVKCDMSKQNISLLEHLKTKITRLQYIALRYMFEQQAAEGNTNLRICLSLLFSANNFYAKNQIDIDSAIFNLATNYYSDVSIDLIIKNLIEPFINNPDFKNESSVENNKTWINDILTLGKKK